MLVGIVVLVIPMAMGDILCYTTDTKRVKSLSFCVVFLTKKRGSMFDVGETVIHKREICKVVGLIKNFRDDKDFYKLRVLDGSGVTIYLPFENASSVLRMPMTKLEAQKLIEKIPHIPLIDLPKLNVAQEYKTLIDSGNHDDLVRVIKTCYTRCEQNEEAHKKAGENDKIYFRLAERILYSELALALGMTFDQTRDYVVARVAALTASRA